MLRPGTCRPTRLKPGSARMSARSVVIAPRAVLGGRLSQLRRRVGAPADPAAGPAVLRHPAATRRVLKPEGCARAWTLRVVPAGARAAFHRDGRAARRQRAREGRRRRRDPSRSRASREARPPTMCSMARPARADGRAYRLHRRARDRSTARVNRRQLPKRNTHRRRPRRVVVTTGSSAAFQLAFLAAFEAGDRVRARRSRLSGLSQHPYGSRDRAGLLIAVGENAHYQPTPSCSRCGLARWLDHRQPSQSDRNDDRCHRSRAARRILPRPPASDLIFGRDLPRDHL